MFASRRNVVQRGDPVAHQQGFFAARREQRRLRHTQPIEHPNAPASSNLINQPPPSISTTALHSLRRRLPQLPPPAIHPRQQRSADIGDVDDREFRVLATRTRINQLAALAAPRRPRRNVWPARQRRQPVRSPSPPPLDPNIRIFSGHVERTAEYRPVRLPRDILYSPRNGSTTNAERDVQDDIPSSPHRVTHTQAGRIARLNRLPMPTPSSAVPIPEPTSRVAHLYPPVHPSPMQHRPTAFRPPSTSHVLSRIGKRPREASPPSPSSLPTTRRKIQPRKSSSKSDWRPQRSPVPSSAREQDAPVDDESSLQHGIPPILPTADDSSAGVSLPRWRGMPASPLVLHREGASILSPAQAQRREAPGSPSVFRSQSRSISPVLPQQQPSDNAPRLRSRSNSPYDMSRRMRSSPSVTSPPGSPSQFPVRFPPVVVTPDSPRPITAIPAAGLDKDVMYPKRSPLTILAKSPWKPEWQSLWVVEIENKYLNVPDEDVPHFTAARRIRRKYPHFLRPEAGEVTAKSDEGNEAKKNDVVLPKVPKAATLVVRIQSSRVNPIADAVQPRPTTNIPEEQQK